MYKYINKLHKSKDKACGNVESINDASLERKSAALNHFLIIYKNVIYE